MTSKKKILVLTSRIPYPPIGGDKLRTFNIVKMLASQYDVDVVTLNEEKHGNELIGGLKNVVNNVKCYSYSGFSLRVRSLFLFFIKGWPLQIGYYWHKEVKEYIDSVVHNYDLLFCFHIRTTEYVKEYNVPKVIDLVDAISLNYKRALENNISLVWRFIYLFEQKKVLEYEKHIINLFDKSFIISSVDKAYLVQYKIKSDKISILPNGVEISLPQTGMQEEVIDVTFLGNMETLANEGAVLYFVREILPELAAKKQDIKFYIVGKNPSKKVKLLHNGRTIFVTGFVSEPMEYLSKTKVVIAPMIFGAGVQNKILEAMYLGKPVVTTTIGAEGIDGEDGEHFVIADEPKIFANKIFSLLSDKQLRENIGSKAQAFVQQHYQWAKSYELLHSQIKNILKNTIKNST